MATMTDQAVREEISGIIGGVKNLPTPPIVFTQIQKVLNNPHTSAYDIANILQEDPAMSAKVLKLTNSAYYGLSRTIESVKQAVVIVGMDAVKNLVLSASVFDAFGGKGVDKEFQDYFWRHSLATAFGARFLARELYDKMSFDPESSFSAGLLHDIGKMVIALYMSDHHQKIEAARTAKPKIPHHAIETEELGYNHTQIGALLGEEWQLPEKLVETIEFHHFPQTAPTAENNLPYLVHLADYLARLTFDVDPADEDPYTEPLQDEALKFLGMSAEDAQKYVPTMREEYFKAETFMEMAKGAA
jgi:putative nucleotidyltransferase with HDIG domain